MRVIGIHGPSRSGKDSVYKILTERYPNVRFERQGFADALKTSAAKSLGMTGTNDELIEQMDELKENGWIKFPNVHISGREFLQLYGTEGHREMFGDDFWLNQVIPNTRNPMIKNDGRLREADFLIIPDVRYANEIKHIRDCPNSYLWKIERDVNGNGTGHASEINLDANWDLVIDNNGTYDMLIEQVVKGFQSLSDKIAEERLLKVLNG